MLLSFGLKGYLILQYSAKPPVSSSMLKMLRKSFSLANLAAELLFKSSASLSAPLCSSFFTTLAFPLITDKCKGVNPSLN